MVSSTPAHPGAEVAGVLLHLDGDVEDVAVEDGDRDAQQGGVGLDQRPVGRVVARVHHQEFQRKGMVRVALELLHQLGQDHGVLAAGDADRDAVLRLHQLIALDGGDEGVPELLAVFFDETALGDLLGCQFTGHGGTSGS